jgi:hypothetical protein
MTVKKENTPEMVYEVVLPHLSGPVGLSGAVAAAGDTSGHWESIQLSGTCYFRCILACFRYLLKSEGLAQYKQKELFFALRLAFVVRCQRGLEGLVPDSVLAAIRAADADEARESKDGGGGGSGGDAGEHDEDAWAMSSFQESDRRMVELGCAQVAISASKRSKAKEGRLTQQSLEACNTVLGSVRRLLANVTVQDPSQASAAALAVPLRMTESVALEPFQGFDLAAAPTQEAKREGGGTDSLAGGPTEAAPEMFVDLTDAGDGKARSFGEAARAIISLNERCDKLRAKASVSAASIAVNQICTLVEHTFMTVLPIPLPEGAANEAGDGNSNTPCIWTAAGCGPAGIDAQMRVDALEALVASSLHYLAAHWSCESDRASDARRAVVFGAIACVADAVLRVEPTKVRDWGSEGGSEGGGGISCARVRVRVCACACARHACVDAFVFVHLCLALFLF